MGKIKTYCGKEQRFFENYVVCLHGQRGEILRCEQGYGGQFRRDVFYWQLLDEVSCKVRYLKLLSQERQASNKIPVMTNARHDVGTIISIISMKINPKTVVILLNSTDLG